MKILELQDCAIREVGHSTSSSRVLKEVCYYDQAPWYRCPNSAEYYGTIYGSSGLDGCVHQLFDRACSADPHFYQVCGHQGCSGYTEHESGTTLFCSSYVCARWVLIKSLFA